MLQILLFCWVCCLDFAFDCCYLVFALLRFAFCLLGLYFLVGFLIMFLFGYVAVAVFSGSLLFNSVGLMIILYWWFI